jgi:mannose-6-phosphate isomerase-like protein (cupin superfamily)
MKRIEVLLKDGFEVIASTGRSQAATMLLKPGESEGGPNNEHKGSDQWLYVRSGFGEAIVNKESILLKPGVLLLIEAGEKHEIKNTGNEILDTLNFYAPPEY